MPVTRVSVIQEDANGRNQWFRDNLTGETFSKAQFVRKIEHGEYEAYYVRWVQGVKTPVSDMDLSENDHRGDK
ncbi:MAG TPA: hypothetical protein VF756_20280 [Thermoanaerobaculia bacterium]